MSKKLVAYFSASGVTAKLAKKLAEAIDADLFEIKPVEPYSEADQNWKNPLARCNKEKIGKKEVPVSGIVENMDEYDTVYLGFPIWYWAAPNVVNTFVKQYDFSHKKVVLFATSGGSGFGGTTERLRGSVAPGVKIREGALLNGSQTVDSLRDWLKTLAL